MQKNHRKEKKLRNLNSSLPSLISIERPDKKQSWKDSALFFCQKYLKKTFGLLQNRAPFLNRSLHCEIQLIFFFWPLPHAAVVYKGREMEEKFRSEKGVLNIHLPFCRENQVQHLSPYRRLLLALFCWLGFWVTSHVKRFEVRRRWNWRKTWSGEDLKQILRGQVGLIAGILCQICASNFSGAGHLTPFPGYRDPETEGVQRCPKPSWLPSYCKWCVHAMPGAASSTVLVCS